MHSKTLRAPSPDDAPVIDGLNIRCTLHPGCYRTAAYILAPSPDAPPELPAFPVCRECFAFATGHAKAH